MKLGQGLDVVVSVFERGHDRQDTTGSAEFADGQRVGLEVAVAGAGSPLDIGDLVVKLCEPDGQKVTAQCGVIVRRRDLVDLMAQFAQ